MRVQLVAGSAADAVVETVTTVAVAVPQEMAGSWQCEQCAVRDTVCRRAGPSGDALLCNGASLLGGRSAGKWEGQGGGGWWDGPGERVGWCVDWLSLMGQQTWGLGLWRSTLSAD